MLGKTNVFSTLFRNVPATVSDVSSTKQVQLYGSILARIGVSWFEPQLGHLMQPWCWPPRQQCRCSLGMSNRDCGASSNVIDTHQDSKFLGRCRRFDTVFPNFHGPCVELRQLLSRSKPQELWKVLILGVSSGRQDNNTTEATNYSQIQSIGSLNIKWCNKNSSQSEHKIWHKVGRFLDAEETVLSVPYTLYGGSAAAVLLFLNTEETVHSVCPILYMRVLQQQSCYS